MLVVGRVECQVEKTVYHCFEQLERQPQQEQQQVRQRGQQRERGYRTDQNSYSGGDYNSVRDVEDAEGSVCAMWER